jgi:hypothetical protein
LIDFIVRSWGGNIPPSVHRVVILWEGFTINHLKEETMDSTKSAQVRRKIFKIVLSLSLASILMLSISGEANAVPEPVANAANSPLVAQASVSTAMDTYVQGAKLTASDKAVDDRFGFTVDVDGDVVVVGADYADPEGVENAGAAYIFARQDGGWGGVTQVAKLTASDKVIDDRFGISVAIDGDVIVVGAWGANPGGNDNAGVAYVFVKPGGGWMDMTETAKLTASDKAAGDYFGYSVAIDGNKVVVGAYLDDIGSSSDTGSAYVFVKPAGGWTDMTQTAKLTTSGNTAGEYFGFSVGVSGDVVVVGAWRNSPGSVTQAGAAFVFEMPVGGWVNMTQTVKLTASDGGRYDWFGHTVAIEGDVVVVGACYADLGGGPYTDYGAVYVYVRPVGGWVTMTQTARLRASDPAVHDLFGRYVAISGEMIVVGARNASPGGLSEAGKAYLFEMPVGGWRNMTQNATLTASDKAVGDYFGWTVGIDGHVAVIGAFGSDPDGLTDAGAAYLFGPESTTMITTDTQDPIEVGKPVKVSVTVSGESATPTGKVDITGADTNCFITLSGGSGDCDVVFEIQGSKTLTATYHGDAYYMGSSDTEDHEVVKPYIAVFRSQGAYDGFVVEYREFKNIGGRSIDTTKGFLLGDDRLDRQYRAILSFNTTTLPDNAVIMYAMLKIKKFNHIGTDPFTTHQPLRVSMSVPYFGNSISLEKSDFQAWPFPRAVGKFKSTPINNWYHAGVWKTAYPYFNRLPLLQPDRNHSISLVFQTRRQRRHERRFRQVLQR